MSLEGDGENHGINVIDEDLEEVKIPPESIIYNNYLVRYHYYFFLMWCLCFCRFFVLFVSCFFFFAITAIDDLVSAAVPTLSMILIEIGIFYF